VKHHPVNNITVLLRRKANFEQRFKKDRELSYHRSPHTFRLSEEELEEGVYRRRVRERLTKNRI